MIRAPTKETLREWVENAISTLEKTSIVKSFKVCGIILAPDHTEDFFLSQKLKSNEKVIALAQEVEKCYEGYDRFEHPYEDFPSLFDEMRENEHMIYDFDRVSKLGIHHLFFP